MSIITVEIIIIVLLTVMNGILAMSEIAVISARKARLQQWAEKGNRKAKLALEVSNAPGDFLSTVQVGITLVGVLAGAFGGATIAQHLAAYITTMPMIGPYAETISIGLVVLSITYLSLILGELVPKRIALNNPERIASIMAGPMRLLSRITAPVVWLLTRSTNGLLWVLRIPQAEERPVTEEEIKILLRQGAEAGVIQQDERDIVDRVFRLGSRRVSTIMTPRKDLAVLYTTDTPSQILKKLTENGHALYPLCEETHDNVIGIVCTQDLVAQMLSGRAPDLKSIARQPVFLPESVQSFRLLEEFKAAGKDTALLLDEYGGLTGMITATDILRALVGEVSFLDTPKATRRPDGSWLVDGLLPLDEFKETLKIGDLPGQETHSYETAGGLMLYLFGRVPSEGETVIWNQYQMEIIDMDGLRVDKILIKSLKK